MGERDTQRKKARKKVAARRKRPEWIDIGGVMVRASAITSLRQEGGGVKATTGGDLPWFAPDTTVAEIMEALS